MARWIIKRFISAIPTLFLLITISFFMMRLAPGNPFSSEKNISLAVLENLKAKYDLSGPLYNQYFRYLYDLAHGDLGLSFRYTDQTINSLVAAALPVSLKIGLIAFTCVLVFGLSLGMIGAIKQNTIWDYMAMSLATIGIVTPTFVSAPLFVLFFSLKLHWFPAGGWNNGDLMHLILPVTVLSLQYIATLSRITRSSLIEVLHSPFIRTAKAKGLHPLRILFRHSLKPALLPVASYLAPTFVGIITGAMVIENIFGIPGLGQLFLNGALNRDYGLVMSLTILVGTLTIFFNAMSDIIYGIIDPKITY